MYIAKLKFEALGLLGLVAGYGSNWVEGVGRRFGVLVARPFSDCVWAMEPANKFIGPKVDYRS